MTARSILPRLLASATVVAAMTLTVASGTAGAQVYPRSDGQVSRIQGQAAAAETANLAAFRAETTGSTSGATARAPGWTAGAHRLGATLARIAGLLRR